MIRVRHTENERHQRTLLQVSYRPSVPHVRQRVCHIYTGRIEIYDCFSWDRHHEFVCRVLNAPTK